MKQIVLLIAFFLPVTFGQTAFAQRLHAILVADTSSNLAESVQADLVNMKGTLQAGLPENSLRIIELTGNEVTRNNITSTLHHLRIHRNDAVMLYFAGHGGFDRRQGHFLDMAGTGDGRLYRSKVVESITQPMTPRFWAVVTDCCASLVPDVEPVVGAPELRPRLLRYLFLETRGRLDITSSRPGQVSTGNSSGGLFTTAFCNVLNSNADKQLKWDEIFRQTRDGTAMLVEASGGLNYRQRGIKQNTQTPYSFRTMYGKDVNGLRLGIEHRNMVITRVRSNSAAERAGLRRGMRVNSVNGVSMQDDKHLINAVNFSARNARLDVTNRGTGRSFEVRLSY